MKPPHTEIYHALIDANGNPDAAAKACPWLGERDDGRPHLRRIDTRYWGIQLEQLAGKPQRDEQGKAQESCHLTARGAA